MKPNIGVDIDDTIFHTAIEILTALGRFYNEVFSLERVSEYDIAKTLHIDNRIVQEAVDVVIDSSDMSIIKDADKVLQWLSEWYKVNFITFRKEEDKLVTIELLNKIGLSEYSLYLCKNEKKSEIINALDIGVHVEDRGESVIEIYENTDAVCLLMDKPWNRWVRQNSRIIRVFDWKDVLWYFLIRGEFK